MPSARIVFDNKSVDYDLGTEPFPQILQTNNGALLIEIQGTINVGESPLTGEEDAAEKTKPISHMVDIGDIEFTEIDTAKPIATLVVGKRQKLTGKVVKLAKPLAILKMPSSPEAKEIHVTQVLTHKVIFSDRPEPYMEASA